MSVGKSELLEILFEDEFLIAVNKPPGLPSQPTVDKKRPDLYTSLKKQLRSENVFLHHRLDRDTSGVILLAKHKKANAPLTEMFRNHSFQKIYWCLTKPTLSKEQWEIQNHLIARRKDSRSVKMFRTESGGDFAHTLFRKLSAHSEAALVEAQPLTGRTHQIRVHLLHSEAPILGDSLYGGKDTRVPRLMLHAKSLSFEHPVLHTSVQIEAPLPADFLTLLAKWQINY